MAGAPDSASLIIVLDAGKITEPGWTRVNTSSTKMCIIKYTNPYSGSSFSTGLRMLAGEGYLPFMVEVHAPVACVMGSDDDDDDSHSLCIRQQLMSKRNNAMSSSATVGCCSFMRRNFIPSNKTQKTETKRRMKRRRSIMRGGDGDWVHKEDGYGTYILTYRLLDVANGDRHTDNFGRFGHFYVYVKRKRRRNGIRRRGEEEGWGRKKKMRKKNKSSTTCMV